MSRIDELIEDLCPGGVEFKKLSSIVDVVQAPKKIQSKNYLKTGQFPIIDQGQSDIVGYTDDKSTLLPAGEYVLFGDHTLSIKYVDFKFAQGADGLKILRAKPNISTRYLYHCCLQFKIPSRGYSRHWTYMKEVKFPIPPLPVQEEIVRILDTFTKLDAELKIELETRKKQYKYYRDKLLTLDKPTGFKYIDQLVAELCPNGVQFQPIGDFAKCIAGATPKTAISRYWEQGTIPWMSSGEVNKREILDTEAKITEEAYASCSTKLVPANTVVIALAGQGKTRGTVAITRIPLCTNQSLCSVIPNEEVIPDFLFHYLRGQYEQLRQISSGDGTRGGLNLKMINAYRVPVPPIQLQEEIVRILNNLDKLCHDISKGLPAEIEARRKQYEYYRDKLLTFRELEA